MDLRRRFNEVLQVCPRKSARKRPRPHTLKNMRAYLVKKLRRYTNSQCFSSSTLITPHLFFLPRTLLPSSTTVRSEPTTAKGIIAYNVSIISNRCLPNGTNSISSYPDLSVDLDLLIVRLLSVEGVQADVVVNELGANLHNKSQSVPAIHVEIHSPNASDT